MTDDLETAGRRERSLARARIEARHHVRSPAPAPFLSPESSLPFVQRAVSNPPPAEATQSVPPSAPAEMEATTIERETRPPTPEEVADRVYHLFCQDLRREWERQGRG